MNRTKVSGKAEGKRQKAEVLVTVTACMFAACAAAAPDTVLLNGKVFTANPAQPWAEAVALPDDPSPEQVDTAIGDANQKAPQGQRLQATIGSRVLTIRRSIAPDSTRAWPTDR